MRLTDAISLSIVVVGVVVAASRFAPSPSASDQRPHTMALLPDNGAKAEARAAIEVRQPPVPLRWTYKHHAVPVPEDNAPADGPTISDLVTQAGTDQAPPVSQTSAKTAIEADGYRSVRELAQAPDGRWTARALRGTTEITVTVDTEGRVAAQ